MSSRLPNSPARPVQLLLFAGALLASALVRESPGGVVNQAIIWLPTGVAVAGLWLLGPASWWVVALCTGIRWLLFGVNLPIALLGAAGSTTEALLGVLILKRLDFHPAMDRLRDVRALFLAAGLAPLASILFSWLGRPFFWTEPELAFYSGWDGWWRMNVLGALAVIPPALTWLAVPRKSMGGRAIGFGLVLAAGTAGLLVLMMWLAPKGITGILLLNLGLLAALYFIVRHGQRGSAFVGSLAAIVVAVATAHGIGPFTALPQPERQNALQLFELAVATFPLVIGALLAERQSALDRSLEHEDLLASINQNISEGLFRATPDLRFIYVNRAFARIFGLDQPAELLEPERALTGYGPAVRTQLRQLLVDRDSPASEEVKLSRRDGSSFWGRVSIAAVHGRDGSVQHFDGAIGDITARKDLEGQFWQAQRLEAMGKLAGGLAHDFNNLLTVIIAYAEAIQMEAGPEAQVTALAEGVLASARRAASLTHQLLAYSRQQILSTEVLELAPSLDQLGSMLRPLLGEDILLVIQHANLHGRVRIDRGQLEQIILNLVLNARDAMPSGGTLTLTTREALVDATFASTHADLRPGPYMALCVQDTGEGMSAEVQARAFDPFFTTKAQAKGTGLGLSTVYGIARQSGCAIWLESQPGSGTRVWIYLPRVEAELDAEPFGLPSLSVPAGLEVTVLVAEDDPVVREVVLESMRRAGYAVLESVDGQDALHISQRHAGSIDLLVTDVVMPHLGGRELAKTLLTARPGLKVLFMSGYAEEALDLPDGPGGAVDFISKPFTSRELVDRTRRLLQARLSLDLGAPASEAPPPRV